MSDDAFEIDDLREAGEDGGDLMGYYSQGHHDRSAWANACNKQNGAESSYDRRHVNAKQVRHVWWRTVPLKGQPGMSFFDPAEPGSRGAFPVTVWDDLAQQDLEATKRVIREHHRGKCNGIAEGVNWALKYLECHGLDTPERVCFYEQDFYVLSNFSSFAVSWPGREGRFPTSEHLYHWLKFQFRQPFDQLRIGHALDPRLDIPLWRKKAAEVLADLVAGAPSAHEAFKIAEQGREFRRADWDEVRVDLMRQILGEKVRQHEYVRRKLLATGDRELVENSWRDDYWGWGPNRDGQNMLGKLWMEVRDHLRAEGAKHA